MIITILPSSANFHAVAYNEMKVEKGVATLLEALFTEHTHTKRPVPCGCQLQGK